MKLLSTRIRFSQRTRRSLVIIAYLSLLSFVLTQLLGEEVAQALRWAFICLYLVLVFTLAYATGLLDAMQSRYLDERQETLRNRAHRLAFVPVNYFVLGILLSLNLANHWFEEPVFIALVSALGTAIFTLPAVIIAWLEPDPVEESTPPSHKVAL
ncbi:MAG: hypothetical protein KGZ60_04190 [Truepera sp.]|nr:hypothetical protein [Truepera sp.]